MRWRRVWFAGRMVASATLLSSEDAGPMRVAITSMAPGWMRFAAWDNGRRYVGSDELRDAACGPTGASPAIVVTTTPKPTKLMRRILADAGTIITRASTFDNKAHLDPVVLTHLRARYEGSRLGRQELFGELIEDVEGALWVQSLIDQYRVAEAPAIAEADSHWR